MADNETFHLKRLSRELVAEGTLVKLYKDHMQLPHGGTEDWDFVHHKKIGGACCVPILPDGRIVLVEQYRAVNDIVSLELPAGIRDPHDADASLTAARELEEETGYRCATIRPLLHLKAAIAFCDEDTDIYLAEGLTKVGGQTLDDAEEIRVKIFTMDEVLDKIFAGEIPDAKTVAGILAYRVQQTGDHA